MAGLGTVGGGVVKILDRHREMLRRRTGKSIEIVAVSAKDRNKGRGFDISRFQWEDSPVAVAARDDVDVYVELIGGEDGPARKSIETALSSGKDVVTANKAMLAVHGQHLAELAERCGRALRFEAAVAGWNPGRQSADRKSCRQRSPADPWGCSTARATIF